MKPVLFRRHSCMRQKGDFVRQLRAHHPTENWSVMRRLTLNNLHWQPLSCSWPFHRIVPPVHTDEPKRSCYPGISLESMSQCLSLYLSRCTITSQSNHSYRARVGGRWWDKQINLHLMPCWMIVFGVIVHNDRIWWRLGKRVTELISRLAIQYCKSRDDRQTLYSWYEKGLGTLKS